MGMPRYFIGASFAVILIVWLLVAFIGLSVSAGFDFCQKSARRHRGAPTGKSTALGVLDSTKRMLCPACREFVSASSQARALASVRAFDGPGLTEEKGPIARSLSRIRRDDAETRRNAARQASNA
jgi:hypothetical protein